MATRLFSRRHLVMFGRDMRTYAKALQQPIPAILMKNFSSEGSGDRRHPHAIVLLDEATDEATVWPDPRLGLLGPRDLRMPLPGNVGFPNRLPSQPVAQENFKTSWLPEILTCLTNYDRQVQVMKQNTEVEEDEIEGLNAEELEQLLMDLPNPSDLLECVAQDCPKLIRKDFADLFPNRDVTSGPLTVVSLTQKTKNDMAGWSELVEIEREELIACFVDAAKEICQKLNSEGYWADFIDPTSGRPYLGDFTNATLFETDERYRHLGFSIEDLGCCKVIRHGKWGTHSFVGCIFTNAPIGSSSLQQVLRQQHLK